MQKLFLIAIVTALASASASRADSANNGDSTSGDGVILVPGATGDTSMGADDSSTGDESEAEGESGNDGGSDGGHDGDHDSGGED